MTPPNNSSLTTEPAAPSPAIPPSPVAVKPAPPPEYYWLWVVCLLGLDYFSTLAYQPSVTYKVVGKLGPLATALVVLVTLAGLLPVYCYLAGRSPNGHGSIGMLERLVRGWRGKTLVLILLGFAATDFVMLKTISLADAAVHLRADQPEGSRVFHRFSVWCCAWADELLPNRAASFFNDQLVVTLVLGAVGFAFWFLLRKGFNRNVIVLAVPLVAAYLVLNGMVIFAGISHLQQHPEVVHDWLDEVSSGDLEFPHWHRTGWSSAVFLCLLYLPHLALGLSGFEMSMILMPQVRGSKDDDPKQPKTRIANTRKVLIAAGVIMSAFLLGASLVTTLLIPREAFYGSASNRALAYLAHGGALVTGMEPLPWCGPVFGIVYDVVTVLILCLAGTSVMTVLGVLLPQFLLRFGMELRWANRWGVLIILFGGINLLVTLYFQASVDAQRDAYTTSVLVLMTCAALTCALDQRHRHHRARYFTFIAGILIATTLALAVISWNGILIASLFIVAILSMSVMSRAWRVGELRTLSFHYKDDTSKFLWDSLRLADFPVLVPHCPGQHERDLKEVQIRRDHQLAGDCDIVFLEVHVDDPSDFYQNLLVEVVREEFRYVIKVNGCVSVAHAIAAVALEMSRYSTPPGLHFGWTDMDLLSASWTYLAFGQGNVPWKVRELILHAEPDPSRRPRVIVG
jgi:hypothetical protein